MASIGISLGEVETQAGQGMCELPSLLPSCPGSPEEEPLLRASFSPPFCSPAAPSA